MPSCHLPTCPILYHSPSFSLLPSYPGLCVPCIAVLSAAMQSLHALFSLNGGLFPPLFRVNSYLPFRPQLKDHFLSEIFLDLPKTNPFFPSSYSHAPVCISLARNYLILFTSATNGNFPEYIFAHYHFPSTQKIVKDLGTQELFFKYTNK